MASASITTNENTGMSGAELSYMIESAIYAFAMVLGCGAFIYTARRFYSNYHRHMIIAARLMCFKISLTIADLIVLFIYAPTQIIWIGTYYWYGGDLLCRATKFINTFSLHLTANMQVLIAIDRLYITAHLLTIHRKSKYAANQMICLAWLLATACALPQLLVFHASTNTPDQQPQCVSIWTIMRYHRHLAAEGSLYEDEGGNSTDQLDDSASVEQSGSQYAKWIDVDHRTLAVLEHAYNVLHLLSIYIVPYSIELFCYATILLLMKSLHKGARRESWSIGKPARSMTITLASYYTESVSNTDKRDILGKADSSKALAKNNRSRATSWTPLSTKDAHKSKISRRLFGSLPGAVNRRRSAENYCLGSVQTRSSLLLGIQLNPELAMHTQQLVTTVQDGEARSAWQTTMSIARRRTRMKAFLMLTLNMIFWTPYCVLGIISTLTVFDHSAFDFVNAFVVLNAVSNLLL